MHVRRRVDELRRDPDAVAGRADASFYDVADAELAADGLYVGGAAL